MSETTAEAAGACGLFAFGPAFGWPRPWEGPGLFPCELPSAATVTVVCEHEHVTPYRACDGGAGDVQDCAGFLTCRRCEDGPEPHDDCQAAFLIKWDGGGEETVVQEAAGA